VRVGHFESGQFGFLWPHLCRHMPVISVIICTRNRASSLARTLESLGTTAVPDALEAELIVVDNGSMDDTRTIVEAASIPNMTVRYTCESKVGQCAARNRGLLESTGDVIVFTDDDVCVPPDWLARLCCPIIEGCADAVAGGIRIAPHLERPWLSGDLRAWLACTDGNAAIDAGVLVGANMAFARRVLGKVPSFDTELGPGALGFGDDSLFSKQLLKAGYRIVDARDVEVEHHFDERRLSEASFLRIAKNLARSHAYIARHWERVPLSRPLAAFVHSVLAHGYRFGARRNSRPLDGAPARWRLDLTVRGWFLAQYLIELFRRPRYDTHGLTKRQRYVA
jgi:glycosyltransferase involved in cell wall biosynthesis